MPWRYHSVSNKTYRGIWLPNARDGKSDLPPKPSGAAASPLSVCYFTDAHGAHLDDEQNASPRLATVSQHCGELAGDKLFLGGGDDYGGGGPWDAFMSPDSPKPNALYSYLAKLGVDALCPGNHDLDWGMDALCRNLPELLPVAVASNLKPRVNDPERLRPAALFDFEDKRVALLTLANLDHVVHSYRHFSEGIEVLPDLLKHYEKWANLIIVVSHNGTAYDAELQKLLPEHVLLCGAHTHELIPSLEEGTVASNYLQSGTKLKAFGVANWNSDKNWTVSNISLPEERLITAGPAEAELRSELAKTKKARGTIALDSQDFEREDPILDKYRGRSRALNWATDAIVGRFAKGIGTPRFAALCASFMGNRNIGGILNVSDWYQVFPYSDQLYEIDLPWDILPELVANNARRLLEPPGYRPDMGFLHFDNSLQYELDLTGTEPKLRSLFANDRPYRKNRFTSFKLYTHAFVIVGSGGYHNLFESLGLWPLAAKRVGGPIRDLLWKEAKSFSSRSLNLAEDRIVVRDLH